MQPVFISYFREDIKAVDSLCSAISRAGIPFWLDRVRLEAGVNWSQEIENKIANASAFILCISGQFYSKKNSYVHKELALAKNVLAQKHPSELWFFPLLLESVAIPNQPITSGRYLSDYQATIAYPDFNSGIAQLIERLQKFFAQPECNMGTMVFINQAKYSGYVRIDGVEASGERLQPGAREVVKIPAGSHEVDFIDPDPLDDMEYSHINKQFSSNVVPITITPQDSLILAIRSPKSSGMLWWKEVESKDDWILEIVN